MLLDSLVSLLTTVIAEDHYYLIELFVYLSQSIANLP